MIGIRATVFFVSWRICNNPAHDKKYIFLVLLSNVKRKRRDRRGSVLNMALLNSFKELIVKYEKNSKGPKDIYAPLSHILH